MGRLFRKYNKNLPVFIPAADTSANIRTAAETGGKLAKRQYGISGETDETGLRHAPKKTVRLSENAEYCTDSGAF